MPFNYFNMKLYITLLILLSYTYIFIKYTIGWHRLNSKKKPSHEDLIQEGLLIQLKEYTTLKASLIICVHNEAVVLSNILESLSNQAYPISNIIFVNDHSTDESCTLLSNYCEAHSNTHLLHSPAHGKKEALKYGIEKATEEIILLSDADCTFSSTWSYELVYYLHTAKNTKLLLAGVQNNKEHSMWFESLDFASLMATTAASSYYSPILCNGANMCTYRSLWLDYQNHLKEKEISGDDIFYLQALKKDKHIIEYIKNRTCIVETRGTQSWKKFFKQRRRWGSKTNSYQDKEIVAVALAVGIISCAQIMTLFSYQWLYYSILFFGKLGIDSLFTIPFLIDNKQNYLIKYILPFAFIYPFYIIGIAFSNLLFKPKSW